MDRIVQILQKEYDRLEYAMKLGKSIGKENAPEYKQLEIELAETGEAIKILTTNADTGEKQCNLPVVMPCAYLVQSKENLLIHGLFSTYEKAEKYINGSPNMAIQKVDIA